MDGVGSVGMVAPVASQVSVSPARRVVVTGGSGMIGRALIAQLEARRIEVTQLVRRAPKHERERQWNPGQRELDPRIVSGADAVVNLAGSSISRLPWSYPVKKDILRSRVNATLTLTRAMSEAAEPPAALVNASAVGAYGDRPGERLTEASETRGTGFLGRVVDRWERAAGRAPEGTRTAILRFGIVLGRDGGTFALLRGLGTFGLLGKLGTGEQHWPWVSLDDVVRALELAIDEPLSGVFNVVGPKPATATEILSGLATELKRPFVVHTPRPIIELALQDAGRELLLADQLVVPERLLERGFRFRDATVREAIDRLLKAPEREPSTADVTR